MKNFTPYLLLAFVIWVAMRGSLQSYVALATHLNWHVQLPAFLSASGGTASGGAASSSAGSASSSGGGAASALGGIGSDAAMGAAVGGPYGAAAGAAIGVISSVF